MNSSKILKKYGRNVSGIKLFNDCGKSIIFGLKCVTSNANIEKTGEDFLKYDLCSGKFQVSSPNPDEFHQFESLKERDTLTFIVDSEAAYIEWYKNDSLVGTVHLTGPYVSLYLVPFIAMSARDQEIEFI